MDHNGEMKVKEKLLIGFRVQILVRFQGGHNAGHTLVIDKKVFKLLLTVRYRREGKISILGNGVVIDPWALLAEIS